MLLIVFGEHFATKLNFGMSIDAMNLLSSGRFIMASTSDQGYNSNRICRRWLAETFDGHDTAEDDLSDNVNGNDDIIKPSNENLPLNLEPLEPYIGMEFESAEDAREFYEMYGRRVGFTMRNNRTRRSLKDNSIIRRQFVCSKEGFRADKYAHRENRSLPSMPATREGCNAMLRIAAKDGGKWVIYGFVKEHNHELNPSKVPPRRSHRVAFYEDEKDKKIQELTAELRVKKRLSVAYHDQLLSLMKDVEDHNEHLSTKVQFVLNNLKELDAKRQELLRHR
ncbi:unnamed protein product [Camellia sinensis]